MKIEINNLEALGIERSEINDDIAEAVRAGTMFHVRNLSAVTSAARGFALDAVDGGWLELPQAPIALCFDTGSAAVVRADSLGRPSMALYLAGDTQDQSTKQAILLQLDYATETGELHLSARPEDGPAARAASLEILTALLAVHDRDCEVSSVPATAENPVSTTVLDVASLNSLTLENLAARLTRQFPGAR